MSFEQLAYPRSYSHSGNEPPTPTRTPTSPNFFSSSYQTPKQDSRFQDPLSPWTPALGFSPIFNSQAHATYISPDHGVAAGTASTASQASGGTVSTIASNALHSSSDHNVSLAPVDRSLQLASSPRERDSFDIRPGNPTPGFTTTQSQDSIEKAANENIHSAVSIQTPPPTSTSTSRRKVSESHSVRTRTLAPKTAGISTSFDGNMDDFASNGQRVEESPSAHFPSLQFSPDGFSLPMSTGPVTAPVYPQHKLFWDSEQSVEAMNLDFPMADTFTNFGLGLQKQLEPYVSDHEQSNGVQFPPNPAFANAGTGHVNIASLPTSSHSAALKRHNTVSTTAMMTEGSSRGGFEDTAVNPSLLFSSPPNSSQPTTQVAENDTMKPYAHQLQDAVYERELRSRKSKRKRGVELDSPAVKAATQALRGAEDESSVDSTDGTIVSSFAGIRRPDSRHSRKASGHQKSNSTGQGSQRTLAGLARRTSVTLTVDQNGRAKTEAKLVGGQGKSISSRADADSDSSESNSSSSGSSHGIAVSQPSSFAYSTARPRKPRGLKSHRVLDRRGVHSHQSSYASISDPMGATNVSAGGALAASQPQVRFEATTSLIGGTQPGDDSEAETIVDTDEDKGNAASALKKVVRQRSNQKIRKTTTPRQSFADHRMPQSSMLLPYYNQNTTTPSRHNFPTQQQDISPTTITDPDLATPSTGGRSVYNDRSVTRCVCHVKDGDGQLMVQCDSCKYWLHLACVELTQHNIPEIYLCIFCNHETPKNRGARRGEPAKANFPPPTASPLAYKSNPLYR